MVGGRKGVGQRRHELGQGHGQDSEGVIVEVGSDGDWTPSETRLDIGCWNMCGARLQVLADKLPARVGLILLQEATVMKDCKFWKGYGGMWFMSAPDHYILASMQVAGRQRVLAAPSEQALRPGEHINKLVDVGNDTVAGGEYNWVGAKSMQAVIKDNHEYGIDNEER